MLLDCVGMVYIPGSFALVRGVKRGQKDLVEDGYRFHNRGTGYGSSIMSSEFILKTRCGKTTESFNIVSFFHSNWGKMTKKRVTAIILTMPKQIEKDKDGFRKDDLLVWLEKAKTHHKGL